MIKTKPHFFRLQIDFPFDGDLSQSKYEICYQVCIVEEGKENVAIGKTDKTGIESLDFGKLIERYPDLMEMLPQIQAHVVETAIEQLTEKGVL